MATTTNSRFDVVVNLKEYKPTPTESYGILLLVTKETMASSEDTTTTTKSGTGATGNGATTTPTTPSHATFFTRLTTGNGILTALKDKDGNTYKEYSSVDAVADDFAESTDVYKAATTYFAQEQVADRIAVLSYTADLAKAMGNYWRQAWTFVTEATFDSTEAATLAAIMETHSDKLFIADTYDMTATAAFASSKYTANFVQPAVEQAAAGLVGRAGNLTPGSATFKFKSITGLTPIDWSDEELAQLKANHQIGYLTVGANNQTSEGWTLSGDQMDSLLGQYFIKNEIVKAAQTLFQTHDKIAYDTDGINQLYSVVDSVLQNAADNHIILKDANGKAKYSINTISREDSSPLDVANRLYQGLSFDYEEDGAIHNAIINGVVNIV